MSPSLIITIGPQGAGKSTWAEKYVLENPDVLYLSTDRLRAELGFGVADQTVNSLIFGKLKQRTEEALLKGQSVLLDATFIKKAWRKDNVNLGKRLGARLVAHVFKADRDVLIERINKRAVNGGLFVPVEVIDRYISQFQPPDKTEFDEIIHHQ